VNARFFAMQPNFFATFSLATYPLFVALLFATCRPAAATGLSLLIAEMVLPPGYNLPLSFPTWLGKTSIPPISALIAALLFRRSSLHNTKPFRGIESFFLLTMVFDFFTILTNFDPLHYGPTTVPGQTMRDFSSDCVRFVFDPWIAYYLGRVMFKTSRDLVTLARMMAIAAAVYTIPILIEIRMSPQFNAWFYGYATMSVFGMAIRWGGYRPQVFMGNGIVMSMFMLVCTLMTFALARAKKSLWSIPPKALCAYLVVVLILCKSTGTIVYALLCLPLLMLASPRRALLVAKVLAIFVFAYPLLRMSGLLPVEDVGHVFGSFSAERRQSLEYRFEMEQKMLALTQTRPVFGMGGYGRNFVYDPITGKSQTVPDGAVIMALSNRGIAGCLAFFAPFLFAVVKATRQARRIRTRSMRHLISALALSCGVISFDLILNATLPSIFIMMFGALNGIVPGILAEEAQHEAQDAAGAGGGNRS
jgi:O-antigen ligase